MYNKLIVNQYVKLEKLHEIEEFHIIYNNLPHNDNTYLM